MELSLNKKFMIFEMVKSVTKDDRPYIRVTLLDSDGGQTNGIMFDSNKLDFEPEKGDIVDVTGTLQSYNGQMQLKINNIRKGSSEDILEFLPKSKNDPEEMLQELKNILGEIKCPYIKKLVEGFLKDEKMLQIFKYHPAAKSVHHAYVSGLLEHTLSVIKLSTLMADYYKNLVNKDILLAGALFHDIGKLFELDIQKGFDYTDSGKLLGHILMGIEMVNGYISEIEDFPVVKKNLILHLIASHHGIEDFGAIKKPKTYEAMILHHLDDLDAKMNNISSIFAKENIDSGWSSYDRLLERQLFRYKE